MTQQNNVRVYTTDGDYMPVLVITDSGDVLLKGDTSHDDHYRAMAKGAVKAFQLAGIDSTLKEVWYDANPKYCELTDDHTAFLKANGQQAFLNEAKPEH